MAFNPYPNKYRLNHWKRVSQQSKEEHGRVGLRSFICLNSHATDTSLPQTYLVA